MNNYRVFYILLLAFASYDMVSKTINCPIPSTPGKYFKEIYYPFKKNGINIELIVQDISN